MVTQYTTHLLTNQQETVPGSVVGNGIWTLAGVDRLEFLGSVKGVQFINMSGASRVIFDHGGRISGVTVGSPVFDGEVDLNGISAASAYFGGPAGLTIRDFQGHVAATVGISPGRSALDVWKTAVGVAIVSPTEGRPVGGLALLPLHYVT